jgi:hypothetical protein
MKDEDRVESSDLSPEREPEPQLNRLDENVCFTPPIHFFIMHNTCNNNNTQQQVPSTLGVSVSEWVKRNNGLCREIISDDASKKTSLLQH